MLPHQSPVAEPIPFKPRFFNLFIYLSPVFTWENNDQYGVFFDLSKRYADALGPKGISKYKELKAEILSRKDF